MACFFFGRQRGRIVVQAEGCERIVKVNLITRDRIADQCAKKALPAGVQFRPCRDVAALDDNDAVLDEHDSRGSHLLGITVYQFHSPEVPAHGGRLGVGPFSTREDSGGCGRRRLC